MMEIQSERTRHYNTVQPGPDPDEIFVAYAQNGRPAVKVVRWEKCTIQGEDGIHRPSYKSTEEIVYEGDSLNDAYYALPPKLGIRKKWPQRAFESQVPILEIWY